MSEHEWQPGDVAMVRGDVCLRTENGLWEHGRGDRFAYHAVEDVPHPLVVIDPESAEQVERLYDLFSDTAHESPVDGLQAALREFAAPTPPKPQVYKHLTVRGRDGLHESLCGKVWTPPALPDEVEVMGKCPECRDIAESGWTA